MEKNIKKINKQIASFMLVSLALSAVAIADTKENLKLTTYSSEESGYNYQEIMDMYAAPEMLNERVKTRRIEAQVARYAAPESPIREIKPTKPEPIAVPMYAAPEVIEDEGYSPIKPSQPVIMKYGAPQVPETEINIPLKQKIEELEKKQNKKDNSTDK